jgi:hypothetical protein
LIITFILGIIFGQFIQPVLDGLTSLVLSFIEMIKNNIAIKIAINNQKIQQLSSEVSRPTIGFSIETEVEE